MTEKNAQSLRIAIILTIIILTLLVYLPAPAFSQQAAPPRMQDLIVNGGFEGGFQEQFGIGYGWGGFSNGNAIVGWNYDDWRPVVAQGQYSQRIEIKDALETDRLAGIYQTVSVVPGQPYKLVIQGLIRSEEGSINLSDYGYRLQVAIDYDGGTAWELLPAAAWQELPWDEQPLSEVDPGYKYNTYEATVTAKTEQLTIFIRGWKKWVNDGVGLFNLDEVSFVGPAPDGFQAPVTRAAAVSRVEEPAEQPVAAASQPVDEVAPAAEALPAETESDSEVMASTEEAADVGETDTVAEVEAPETRADSGPTAQDKISPASEAMTEPAEASELVLVGSEPLVLAERNNTLTQPEAAPQLESAPLPVSGYGPEESLHFPVVAGAGLLLVLFVGAVTAAIRQRT
jgi:hypothetical protein